MKMKKQNTLEEQKHIKLMEYVFQTPIWSVDIKTADEEFKKILSKEEFDFLLNSEDWKKNRGKFTKILRKIRIPDYSTKLWKSCKNKDEKGKIL